MSMEASYIGLYTFIISLIALSGGTIAEAKLDRFLKRTNADQNTPVDKTDKLLLRMIKDGYLVKHKDSSTGDEVIEYMIGPRGKTEVVDSGGVEGLVKTVYGDDAVDDLDRRIKRSMGLEEKGMAKRQGEGLAGRDEESEVRE